MTGICSVSRERISIFRIITSRSLLRFEGPMGRGIGVGVSFKGSVYQFMMSIYVSITSINNRGKKPSQV